MSSRDLNHNNRMVGVVLFYDYNSSARTIAMMAMEIASKSHKTVRQRLPSASTSSGTYSTDDQILLRGRAMSRHTGGKLGWDNCRIGHEGGFLSRAWSRRTVEQGVQDKVELVASSSAVVNERAQPFKQSNRTKQGASPLDKSGQR